MSDKRGFVHAIFLFLGLMSVQVFAQSYPEWFLQQNRDCDGFYVGYAKLSFYPDSAAKRAIYNGYENYARRKWTYISGGQAFWTTEYGMFWMGDSFKEVFDTSFVDIAQANLTPLDTVTIKNFVVVLLGDSSCPEPNRRWNSVKQKTAPIWTQEVPTDSTYLYSVGLAPEYYYEKSSWLEAEKKARRNLARTYRTEVKTLHKFAAYGEGILNEEISVTLRNIQVVARWRDVKEKIVYVLARTKKE